jgi:hypothetical protein
VCVCVCVCVCSVVLQHNSTAGAVIQYNLVVAFAIRGELDKAGDTLKQVCSADLFSTLLIKTSVYDTCSVLPAEQCHSSPFLHSYVPPYVVYKISSSSHVEQFYFYCIKYVIFCVLTPCSMVRWVPTFCRNILHPSIYPEDGALCSQ